MASPHRQGPRGRATPDSLTLAEKSARAVELRRLGHTYREIAREMGITQREAHRLVTKVFAETRKAAQENAAEYIQLHNERLEHLYRALVTRHKDGYLDPRMVEVALKVLERQAKLNGLDAPVKQEVKVAYQGLTDDELLAEAHRQRLDVKVLGVSGPLLPGEQSLPPELEAEVVAMLPPADAAASAGGDAADVDADADNPQTPAAQADADAPGPQGPPGPPQEA